MSTTKTLLRAAWIVQSQVVPAAESAAEEKGAVLLAKIFEFQADQVANWGENVDSSVLDLAEHIVREEER